jgi:hypothetical protein
MSGSSDAVKSALFGADGELVLLRAAVDPRFLEELLDVLAQLDFPVNPELLHRPGQVVVEFPAYQRHVEEACETLRNSGLEGLILQVCGVLTGAANS